jgi:hypothetical protein
MKKFNETIFNFETFADFEDVAKLQRIEEEL